ncbi:lipoyl(octanoyl) transferase LipB [Agarilytica rhodophyticola]|uniref:lipoyl(octanoyl) transferase LipB n=1 Tax=Agarilytica rhodophyticola TaxID=1737490 RepID=UPI000B3451D9|nr:lipoyl(octanoyl) transferase LipB [Agarilytica rhodophyticola]
MSILNVKNLGLMDYQESWQAMRTFTDKRDAETVDELWLVEHPPVFTQGQAGKPEHILNTSNIPIVETDRGGQVTYHGPGQLVAYPLLDLKRLKLGVRDLVTLLEQSVIELLQSYGIESSAKADAPGVYVDDKKIASLGLRVRRGCSYHGVAINVDMDLGPFLQINPCGYQGLEMIQIKDLVTDPDALSMNQLMDVYAKIIAERTSLTFNKAH